MTTIFLRGYKYELTPSEVKSLNEQLGFSPMKLKILADDLRECEAKLASIRNSYSGLQSWSAEDRAEHVRLRGIRESLKQQLGRQV